MGPFWSKSIRPIETVKMLHLRAMKRRVRQRLHKMPSIDGPMGLGRV